mmetsp:Transcript_37724/g.82286  ORF Transcript_37724/g.82286 Transcript_37724/m.82286 type:complete len:218 (-) Transcript_37724:273-926(-)
MSGKRRDLMDGASNTGVCCATRYSNGAVRTSAMPLLVVKIDFTAFWLNLGLSLETFAAAPGDTLRPPSPLLRPLPELPPPTPLLPLSGALATAASPSPEGNGRGNRKGRSPSAQVSRSTQALSPTGSALVRVACAPAIAASAGQRRSQPFPSLPRTTWPSCRIPTSCAERAGDRLAKTVGLATTYSLPADREEGEEARGDAETSSFSSQSFAAPSPL